MGALCAQPAGIITGLATNKATAAALEGAVVVVTNLNLTTRLPRTCARPSISM